MAELAGRCADGLNAPAGPHLPDLIKAARNAATHAGRDPDHFIVTASAELDQRARLEADGVDRMVVYIAPPYLRAIEACRL
jgi:alkanesulfonate monooxygenase SsuD/methylene tetrahydromethanopterin reductase-like flavin-dependent oxidoreductase (luciferase family)